jgi:hypothetical protein
MDWQAILSALLKWTWKQAFAIAAGGFTTLYGVRHGYIEGTTEFTIAYLTFAASWYLVALIVERITKFVVETGHKRAAVPKSAENSGCEESG